MRMHTAGLALALLASTPLAAAEPCGSVEFKSGRILLGQAFGEDAAENAEVKACLGRLAKEIQSRRLIRSVTVAVRVPDAERTDGKALKLAKKVADVLVQAGVPKTRVFAVAPRTEGSEPFSIQLGYTERSPEHVVAHLAVVDGDVRVGENEAALRPAEPGAPVLGNELIATGKGTALVRLKDGSGFKVQPGSQVKLLKLQVTDTLERQVKMEVLRGEIDANVAKASANSTFEASTRNAVASVRGTVFKFGISEGGESKLETREGAVALAGKVDGVVGKPVEVRAGQGAQVDVKGAVEPPRTLLYAPRVAAPLKGAFPSDATLHWEGVRDAKEYLVELARDADFTMSRRAERSTSNTLQLTTPPAAGKWFWRVSAVDSGGFSGAPSKVYAFTVAP